MAFQMISQKAFDALDDESWKRTAEWLQHVLEELARTSPKDILDVYASQIGSISRDITATARRHGFITRDEVLALARLQIRSKDPLNTDVLERHELSPEERLDILQQLARMN
jgi:hypothetical protein